LAARVAAVVARMAFNARAKNLGPHWDRLVAALMKECGIDCTAKMAKLLRDVQQGKVIEARVAGEE
jgi:hypothetical protein